MDDLKKQLGLLLQSDEAMEIFRELINENMSEKDYEKLITEETLKGSATLLKPVITELRDKNITKVIKLEKNEYKIDPSTTHAKVTNLVTNLGLFKQAMIVGPTGSGKSTLAEQCAKIMGLDYASYSCNEEASKTELIGFNDLSGYNYPDFLRLYEEGGVMLIDEYDAMSPGMALVLNAAFDRSGRLSVPTRKDNPAAFKHKDFYCILAGNTWGNASVEYSGRDMQDRAFLDRFKMCRVFIDYDEELERSLTTPEFSRLFHNMRKELVDLGIDDEVSTRTIVDAFSLYHNGFELKALVQEAMLHWDDGDKDQMMARMEGYISDFNKTAKVSAEGEIKV